jgi:hypothetical protein
MDDILRSHVIDAAVDAGGPVGHKATGNRR